MLKVDNNKTKEMYKISNKDITISADISVLLSTWLTLNKYYTFVFFIVVDHTMYFLDEFQMGFSRWDFLILRNVSSKIYLFHQS